MNAWCSRINVCLGRGLGVNSRSDRNVDVTGRSALDDGVGGSVGRDGLKVSDVRLGVGV